MARRFDMMSPRAGRDKTFWVRVGTAFEGDKGIQLLFDALPLPDKEGRCAVSLFEPRERDAAPRGGQQSGGRGGYDTDEPPF